VSTATAIGKFLMPVVLVLLATSASWSLAAYAKNPIVVGYLEKAVILPERLVVDAKMDTGSDITTIHAIQLKHFDRNGESWVRFMVEVDGRPTIFRRRIIRTVSIKRAETKIIKRPVVELRICISGRSLLTKVTLTDRTGFYAQMLVGRPYMKSNEMMVNPAAIYLGNTNCRIG